MKKEDVSNLLIVLPIIPYNSLLVKGGDFFILNTKALIKDSSHPFINKKVGVYFSVYKTFNYNS